VQVWRGVKQGGKEQRDAKSRNGKKKRRILVRRGGRIGESKEKQGVSRERSKSRKRVIGGEMGRNGVVQGIGKKKEYWNFELGKTRSHRILSYELRKKWVSWSLEGADVRGGITGGIHSGGGLPLLGKRGGMTL